MHETNATAEYSGNNSVLFAYKRFKGLENHSMLHAPSTLYSSEMKLARIRQDA